MSGRYGDQSEHQQLFKIYVEENSKCGICWVKDAASPLCEGSVVWRYRYALHLRAQLLIGYTYTIDYGRHPLHHKMRRRIQLVADPGHQRIFKIYVEEQ
jgi:hypothetical protein